MKKYVYLLTFLYGSMSFYIGWNHLVENGPDIFSMGMISCWPFSALFMTTIYLSDLEKKEKLKEGNNG